MAAPLRAHSRRRGTVLILLLAVELAGCGSNQYRLPSQPHVPSTVLPYQQAVEQHYHTVVKNLDQAIHSEEVTLGTDPAFAAGYVRLGGLFFMAGQDQASLKALETACHLAPRSAADQVVLGQTAAAIGRLTVAQNAYRQALRFNPGAWQAWDGLGFLATGRSQYQMAWQDGQSALVAAGEEGPTLDLLGRVLIGEGDMTDALRYFADATQVEPDWWQSYYDKGRAYLALGDVSKARRNFSAALSLDPANGVVWDALENLHQNRRP